MDLRGQTSPIISLLWIEPFRTNWNLNQNTYTLENRDRAITVIGIGFNVLIDDTE